MVLSHNKLIVIGGGDGPDLYQAHAQISDQSAPPQLIGSAQAAGQAAHSNYLCGTPRPAAVCPLGQLVDSLYHTQRAKQVTSIIARVTSSICLTAFGW
jgi:hypothetical protein